jgi:hypothetical protein
LGVTERLPLSALLSEVLVAFTIEFDNAMYENFMRFVHEDGICVAELQRLTRHSNKSMQQWLERLNPDRTGLADPLRRGPVRQLRVSLERLVGEPLSRGLEPYPDGWRASVPRAETLPQYHMVLHRGGFPDGT